MVLTVLHTVIFSSDYINVEAKAKANVKAKQFKVECLVAFHRWLQALASAAPTFTHALRVNSASIVAETGGR